MHMFCLFAKIDKNNRNALRQKHWHVTETFESDLIWQIHEFISPVSYMHLLSHLEVVVILYLILLSNAVS